MEIRKTLLITGMLAVSLTSIAQLRLPPFDISVKTGYLIMPDDYHISGSNNVSNQYESVWLQGELNFHIGQRIAVGGFLNKTLTGIYLNKGSDQKGLDAEHLMYGGILRLSAGRSARVRPYLQFKYFRFESVVHGGGYDVATRCVGVQVGGGLMIRLSNKLYLNVPDLEMGTLFDRGDLLFRDDTVMPKAGAGITYNFSRRK